MIRIVKGHLVGKLSAGLLATGMMITSLLLAADPGHADTTFTVTNTSDGGSGSLRQTILDANATPGADTIRFNIPGTGVKTITPDSALPAITEQVAIDGYTQTGARANTLAKGTNAVLKIQLNGSRAGPFTGGLDIRAKGTVIRGLVISSFAGNGVLVQFDGDGSRLEGNFIGTDPSGTLDQGNGAGGVDLASQSTNTVGGGSPAARNLISGNNGNGVQISEGSSNKVLGNLIGTNKDGVSPLGNGQQGLAVISSSSNNVGGGSSAAANTIAFNGSDGVLIQNTDANGNRILRNSVFGNGGLGVKLGVDGPTANDPGDADVGANGLQNKPVLTSAKIAPSKTTVRGKLNSTPNALFTVRFFSNPSGNEGKRFIGQRSVTTDGSGNVSFTFVPKQAVSVGQTVTATATKNSTGDTSEFSGARKVVKAT